MKKIVSCISALCLAVIMLLSCAVPVMADSDYYNVIDMAGILSDGDWNKLVEHAVNVSEKHGCEIFIITDATDIADSEGNTDPADVLDSYITQMGYGKNGPKGDVSIAVLYNNTTTRDYYISGYGSAEKAINNDAISYIGDQIVPYLKSGDYYSAYDTFISLSDDMYVSYEEGKPYKRPFGFGMALVISLAIGFIAGFIYVGSLKSQLKSVAAVDTAADYVVPGSMNLEQSNEFFLYRTVNRVKRETSSSSSTGSHSGRSHSGGGGKY